MENNKLISYESITLPWTFYKDFITDKLNNKLIDYIENKFSELDEDERFIDGYSITYPTDLSYCYGELFLLDINLPDNKYLPVNFPMINTSSPYAMVRCGIEPDETQDNDDHENNISKTKEEILELCTKTVNNLYEINDLLDEIIQLNNHQVN